MGIYGRELEPQQWVHKDSTVGTEEKLGLNCGLHKDSIVGTEEKLGLSCSLHKDSTVGTEENLGLSCGLHKDSTVGTEENFSNLVLTDGCTFNIKKQCRTQR